MDHVKEQEEALKEAKMAGNAEEGLTEM